MIWQKKATNLSKLGKLLCIFDTIYHQLVIFPLKKQEKKKEEEGKRQIEQKKLSSI